MNEKREKRWLSWQTTSVVLAASFVVQFILITQYLPMFLKHSRGRKNPDQLFWYTDRWLMELYAILGEQGRLLYRKILLVDFLYIFLTAAGFWMLLTLLTRGTKWSWAVWVPLLLAGCDCAENLSQLSLLASYPTPVRWLMTMSRLSSCAKMSLAMVGMTLVVGLLLRAGYLRWPGRRQMPREAGAE